MKQVLFNNCSRLQHKARGVGLIELMVAITIGLILVFGATTIYVNSKNSYEVNESVARLQENARYALSVLEPDIRMAGNWGFVNSLHNIDVSATVGPATCGAGFATNFRVPVQSTDNGSTPFPCPAHLFVRAGGGSGLAMLSADTITVRRASSAAATPTAATLQICSRVIDATMSDAIGASCPSSMPPNDAQQLNDVIVNTYYLSRDSTQAAGTPSLRRIALVNGPAFSDVEIIPNIEDLQIQFGISTGLNSANAAQYVNPGAVPAGVNIVSVRIWLLVRAENPEAGFTDTTTYAYGDRVAANGVTADLNAASSAGLAYQPNDRFRRLLFSRTVHLRNVVAAT